jgi:hypothetical protein
MNCSIIQFTKSTLVSGSTKELAMSNVSALIVDHTADVVKSSSDTLLFTISMAPTHAPYIKEEEFVIVIREKVDLTARGPNDIFIKNAGKDVGEYEYVDSSPYRPLEMPIGFKELKGK